MSKKNFLILTATVSPPSDSFQLARVDSAVRLTDYKIALEFYIKFVSLGVISYIVFCDNSESDITVLRKLAKELDVESKVEFLSFAGLDHPANFGRGYGEFKLLDYVMKNSEFIRRAAADDKIWKITGRYIVKNLGELVQTSPENVDFYCNFRNYPSQWIDLFIFSFKKDFYLKIINGLYVELREDTGLKSSEILFRDKLNDLNKSLKICFRFKRTPLLSGRRGFDNQEYEKMFFKIWFRKIAVRLTPWFWI